MTFRDYVQSSKKAIKALPQYFAALVTETVNTLRFTEVSNTDIPVTYPTFAANAANPW